MCPGGTTCLPTDCCFIWASTIRYNIQLSALVEYKVDIISSNVICTQINILYNRTRRDRNCAMGIKRIYVVQDGNLRGFLLIDDYRE